MFPTTAKPARRRALFPFALQLWRRERLQIEMAESRPRGDWDPLVVPVRRELSRDKVRLVYLLVYSVKSWNTAHRQVLIDCFGHRRWRFLFQRSEKFSEFRANFRAVRSVKQS